LNWIRIKPNVFADDRDFFDHRLCDDEAIKRVFVVEGQIF